MNKRAVIGFFALCVLLALYRLLLPVGDEPDYGYRLSVVYAQLHSLFPFSLLPPIDICVHDTVAAGPLSVFAAIKSMSSQKVVEYNFARYYISVVLIVPLYLVIIYGTFFYRVLLFVQGRYSFVAWRERLEVLMLTTLLPASVYGIGVVGLEALVLILAYFIYLFVDFWWVVVVLLIAVSFMDYGSVIVLLVLLFALRFVPMVLAKPRWLGWSIIAVSLWLISLFGFQSLSGIMMWHVPVLSDKAASIYQSYSDGGVWAGVNEKYLLVLRPIITLMGLVFMLPSGVKSIFAYVFVLYCFVLTWSNKGYRVSRNSAWASLRGRGDAKVVGVVVGVFALVFAVPSFSNAKYYLFILPFVVSWFYANWGYYRVFWGIFLLNLIVLASLAMYRLNGYI